MKKVIRFTASWCGPCKALAKTLENIKPDIAIEICDIDTSPDIAQKYGVRGVPTLVLLDEQGNESKRLVGAKPELELRKWLA